MSDDAGMNDLSRRSVLGSAGVAGLLGGAGGLTAALAPNLALADAAAAAAPGAAPVGATLLEYLTDLERTVAQLSQTWRPDDPQYRADVYRQTMMNFSWAYFAFFHADAEHPDWAPLWNPVYTDQPNPDDIYVYSPIRGDLTYRISGDRGTCAFLTFNVQKGWVGMSDTRAPDPHSRNFDQRDLKIGPGGELDLILSAKRPAGYTGDWIEISPNADTVVLRYVMIDWAKERDPQLSIECLDRVPPKPRLGAEEILRRIREMAKLPARFNNSFYANQNSVKAEAGINKVVQRKFPDGGLNKQVYWPAVFELNDGEALIIETDLPKVRPYWNIQLNDPYFNAVEIVYRLSSINESTAKISSDGKFRAVIALEDPGVPNWLDPGGFKQGTLYGRWFDCDSAPIPTIKRVKLAQLRKNLPRDTGVVTPEQREEELRTRVRAAQRRRRW